MLDDLGPEAFREELRQFSQVMDRLGIRDAKGFRAPTFSLDNQTRWAVPILEEFGYQYDSSIFPMRNHLYGVRRCPSVPYPVAGHDVTQASPDGAGQGLWEFPLSVWRQGPLKVPVSGGFYLRALPPKVLFRLLKSLNERGQPFVIYLHPWETYEKTPRVEALSLLSRWVTYVNTGRTFNVLSALLETFEFAALERVLSQWRATHANAQK
jgi:hypothetical protein